MFCFFSLGDRTISKVFVPLIPTSSSCLNLEEGGYLCQPRSSSSAGPLTLSKLPRPPIVDITVIGSPTCTFFGFAYTVMLKLPTAPENLAGPPGGNGLTSSGAASLTIGTSRRSPVRPKGSAKNRSENGPSILTMSKGEREC